MVGKTWATVSALSAVKKLDLGYTPKNLNILMTELGITRRMVAKKTGVAPNAVTAWRAPIGTALHCTMSAEKWQKFLQMRIELTEGKLK